MKHYDTCHPKYYGRGVTNCENKIKGLDKILAKIEENKENGRGEKKED